MKNMIKLVGIIALVAVIGFGMTACSDDDGNDNNNGGGQGVTVTFSLDKVDARTFTATVDGAKWHASFSDSSWSANNALDIFDYNANTVTGTSAAGGNTSTPYVSNAFDVTRTSDTVLTFVLKDFYSSVSGTIGLNTNLGWFNSFVDVSQEGNTYIINSAKASITF